MRESFATGRPQNIGKVTAGFLQRKMADVYTGDEVVIDRFPCACPEPPTQARPASDAPNKLAARATVCAGASKTQAIATATSTSEATAVLQELIPSIRQLHCQRQRPAMPNARLTTTAHTSWNPSPRALKAERVAAKMHGQRQRQRHRDIASKQSRIAENRIHRRCGGITGKHKVQ